jgi:alpha-amylase
MLQRALVYLLLASLLLSACQRQPPTPTPRRVLPTFTPTVTLPTSTPLPAGSPTWFRTAVVYQAFPRSFYDSDGDGVGDLAGITQQLDYLSGLGITALHLLPVFSAASPDGYAVIDHLAVAAELGTQQELATLVDEAHLRSIRVILDFPTAYCSDQHPFFQEAYSNPESAYSPWYLWQNDAHTKYESFGNDKTLPLLNLENAEVQRYLLETARYWLDVNNDGNLTNGPDGFNFPHASLVPVTFWQALRADVKAIQADFVLLGEVEASQTDEMTPYFAHLDALFDNPFYTILAGSPDKNADGLLGGRAALETIATQLQVEAERFPPAAQLIRFASSHTTNRLASELGGSLARQKQAAALILTLPGTPLVYYGEEAGLKGSRGAATGPMDWAAIQAQEGQAESLLEAYRLLVGQRRAYSALGLGGFQSLETPKCPTCLAYWRWDRDDFYLVLLNLSSETQATTIDFTNPPRPVRGAGEDVLRGGTVNVPSNGRYTLTIEGEDVRILHWGKP